MREGKNNEGITGFFYRTELSCNDRTNELVSCILISHILVRLNGIYDDDTIRVGGDVLPRVLVSCDAGERVLFAALVRHLRRPGRRWPGPPLHFTSCKGWPRSSLLLVAGTRVPPFAKDAADRVQHRWVLMVHSEITTNDCHHHVAYAALSYTSYIVHSVCCHSLYGRRRRRFHPQRWCIVASNCIQNFVGAASHASHARGLSRTIARFSSRPHRFSGRVLSSLIQPLLYRAQVRRVCGPLYCTNSYFARHVFV